MRQPLLVRQRKLPKPVQKFQILVNRIEVSEHKELVDAAVLNGKGIRVQKMPELGAPYLPVARHAIVLIDEGLHEWTKGFRLWRDSGIDTEWTMPHLAARSNSARFSGMSRAMAGASLRAPGSSTESREGIVVLDPSPGMHQDDYEASCIAAINCTNPRLTTLNCTSPVEAEPIDKA